MSDRIMIEFVRKKGGGMKKSAHRSQVNNHDLYEVLRKSGYKSNGKPIQKPATFLAEKSNAQQKDAASSQNIIKKLLTAIDKNTQRTVDKNNVMTPCAIALLAAIENELDQLNCRATLTQTDVETFNKASAKKSHLDNMQKQRPLADIMYLLKHMESQFQKIVMPKLSSFPIMIEPVKDYRSSFPVKKNKPIINNVRPRYSKSNREKLYISAESKKLYDRLKTIQKSRVSLEKQRNENSYWLSEDNTATRIQLISKLMGILRATTGISSDNKYLRYNLQGRVLSEIYSMTCSSVLTLFIAFDKEKQRSKELTAFMYQLLKQTPSAQWSQEIKKCKNARVIKISDGLLDNSFFYLLDPRRSVENQLDMIQLLNAYSILMHFGCETYWGSNKKPLSPFTIFPSVVCDESGPSPDRFSFIFREYIDLLSRLQECASKVGVFIGNDLRVSVLGNRFQLYKNGEIMFLDQLMSFSKDHESISACPIEIFQLRMLVQSFDQLKYHETESLARSFERLFDDSQDSFSLARDFKEQLVISKPNLVSPIFNNLYEIKTLFSDYLKTPEVEIIIKLLRNARFQPDVFQHIMVKFSYYLKSHNKAENRLFVEQLFSTHFFAQLKTYLTEYCSDSRGSENALDDKVPFKNEAVGLLNQMFYIANSVIYARLRCVLVGMSSVLIGLFKLRAHFVRLFLYITRGLQDLSDLSFIENGKIVGANNTSLLFDLFNHAFCDRSIKGLCLSFNSNFSKILYAFINLLDFKFFNGRGNSSSNARLVRLYQSLLENLIDEYKACTPDFDSDHSKYVSDRNNLLFFYKSKIEPLHSSMNQRCSLIRDSHYGKEKFEFFSNQLVSIDNDCRRFGIHEKSLLVFNH